MSPLANAEDAVEEQPGGYYDYHPTIALRRPVVLGGVPSSPYREVGHNLGALVGLPLVDLDHWIEHHVGASLWKALSQRGESDLRGTAIKLLNKALTSRPCGLVILGEAALLVETALKSLQEEAALIWLDTSPTALYWNLRQKQREQGSQPFPFVPFPLERFDQLKPLLESLRSFRENADFCLEVVDTLQTVDRLCKVLPRLGALSSTWSEPSL